MPDEIPKWRIDTLDARGGLAFATSRTSHFSETEGTGNPPCVFIGAPGFQPEMVANRALAIAGVRSSFQYRLFIREQEVAFPTLASLTEFVRRVYLRSGGGDGADGAGGERPPPLLPFDRPRFPETQDLFREDGSLADQIAAAGETFYATSKSCPLGLTKPVEWPDAALDTPKQDINAPFVLAHAATILIYEMMNRMPDGRDLGKTTRWHNDARALGQTLAALGLWNVLVHVPYWTDIVNLMKPLRDWKTPFASIKAIEKYGGDETWAILLCSLFFGTGPALDDFLGAEDWMKHWPPFIFWTTIQNFSGLSATSDPIADLCRFPLPVGLSSAVRKDASPEISLYHALVSSVGSPTTLRSNPSYCALVLLAATWVATHNDRPGTNRFGRTLAYREAITPLERSALQSKLGRGWNWLKEHLTTSCFALELEEAIESASDLKYRHEASLSAQA